jgi:hypothetical protein
MHHGLNNDFVQEYRINEALKLNSKKLVGLSQQKKGTSQNFFTKPQTKDRAGTSKLTLFFFYIKAKKISLPYHIRGRYNPKGFRIRF